MKFVRFALLFCLLAATVSAAPSGSIYVDPSTPAIVGQRITVQAETYDLPFANENGSTYFRFFEINCKLSNGATVLAATSQTLYVIVEPRTYYGYSWLTSPTWTASGNQTAVCNLYLYYGIWKNGPPKRTKSNTLATMEFVAAGN